MSKEYRELTSADLVTEVEALAGALPDRPPPFTAEAVTDLDWCVRHLVHILQALVEESAAQKQALMQVETRLSTTLEALGGVLSDVWHLSQHGAPDA